MGMRAWRFAGVVVLLATSVRADPTPTERALARELFEQGRSLMADKSYAKACAKLGESQRLDPAPGTLLNLAVCHEAEGKTATSWSEFNDALTLARRDGRQDRVELAKARLAKLKPRLSRLTIEVPAASTAPDLAVRLDGASVGKPVWGGAVPTDPGNHVIEAAAPGRKPFRVQLALGDDADRKRVTIPKLALLESQDAPPSRPKPASVQDPGVPQSGGGQRTAGYVIGGVGIAAIGVGSFFGLRAFSKWDERNSHCTKAGCDPTGVEAGDTAEQSAVIANVGIGIGMVGLAAGTYLVLSAGPSSSTSAATAQPSRDGRGWVLGYQRAF